MLMRLSGVAETSPVSFQSRHVDPVLKRVETVGKVLPHVKAKVVDTKGNVVDVGNPGEVLVAGYLVQKGLVCSFLISGNINLKIRYWNDAQQTECVMKKDEDGTLWMYTGDEGIMDDEGYLKSESFHSSSY